MAYGKSTLGYAEKDYSVCDIGAPTEAKRHFNAVEQTHQVLASASSLADRVQGMVSYLIGPVPESDESRGLSGAPRILPTLRVSSDETASAIRKANEALDRLEKELA
jgi:hypothetical protein